MLEMKTFSLILVCKIYFEQNNNIRGGAEFMFVDWEISQEHSGKIELKEDRNDLFWTFWKAIWSWFVLR